jgi:drug/metabolite transporter, DME family
MILAPAREVRVDPWGVAFAVVSGCCYGAHTVSAKKFLDSGLPSGVSIAATLVLGGVLLLPLIAWHPGHLLDPATVTLIAWIGVVGTAMAYFLFGRGLTHTTAATAGTLSLSEPLTAALACLGCSCLESTLRPRH